MVWAVIVFWCGAALVAYTFVGYPLLMLALARLRRPAPPAEPAEWPRVTAVVAMHNEAERAAARVTNLLASDYPADRLDVVVVLDAPTDDTAAALTPLAGPRLTVLVEPERRGKAACLNRGVAATRGEIVVFADARQDFEPGAVRALVRHFSDPQTGAVSGELAIAPAAAGAGRGVDAYWRLETALRAAEGQWDSVIGCTGAIYAVRRELYQPLPPDTLLDDLVVPLQVAAAGCRVGFESAAVAVDPLVSRTGREAGRKWRTLAGNWQLLWRHPGWLFPWGHRLWWQLISHKYLRLLAPYVMVLLLVVNVFLPGWPWHSLLAAQLAFYGLGLIGLARPGIRWRLVAWPAGFVLLNAMSAVAPCYWLTRRNVSGGWPAAGPKEGGNVQGR